MLRVLCKIFGLSLLINEELDSIFKFSELSNELISLNYDFFNIIKCLTKYKNERILKERLKKLHSKLFAPNGYLYSLSEHYNNNDNFKYKLQLKKIYKELQSFFFEKDCSLIEEILFTVDKKRISELLLTFYEHMKELNERLNNYLHQNCGSFLESFDDITKSMQIDLFTKSTLKKEEDLYLSVINEHNFLQKKQYVKYINLESLANENKKEENGLIEFEELDNRLKCTIM